MKKLTKRVVALFLTLAMLIPLICVYPFALTAEDMTDYSGEHWAAEALKWAVEYELIKGYDDGTIRPDAHLTRAEMATVINRAFGATILADISKFVDVNINDWHYEEAAKAVNMGTFEGNEHKEFLPNDYIRREEAFAVIARALVLEGGKVAELEKFGDYENVSDWSKVLLASLTENGYINGSPVEGQEKNNIYPRSNITRAEFAQLLYNIFDNIVSITPVKGQEYEGNVLINYNKGKLVVENVVVKGDLIIADGVALNDVVLKNVTVEGRLVIRGGKNYSLNGVTVGEHVVVCNNNTTVNFDNYKTEDVFDGIKIKTPATFKKVSTGGGQIVVGPTVTNAEYKVQYFLEALDGTFAMEEEFTYNGRIGTVIDGTSDAYKYDEKAYTGFTYDATNANNVTSGSVVSGGTLVLKFYYTRNEYDVTFDYNGGKDASDNTSSTVKVMYKATNDYIAYPTVTKTGYAFDGWYTELNGGERIDNKQDFEFDKTEATTYYAKWIPSDGTAFKIEIYQQNVADDNYVLFETLAKEGTTDAQVSYTEADLPSYVGFYFDNANTENVLEGTIAPDGSLVLKAYYNRIVTTVTFDYNGGKDANDNTYSTVDLKYGADLVLPTGITRAGYAFNGWYNEADDSAAPAVYEEVTDTTYYIDWLEADTTYTLVVYTMQIDGTYDAGVTTANIPAVTGSTVNVIEENIEGLYLNRSKGTLTAVVKGDGTTTLVAYYDRYLYDVVFMWQGNPIVEETVYHGAKLPEDKFEWINNVNSAYVYYDNALGREYAHVDEDGNRGIKNNSWVEILGTDTYSEAFTPDTVVTKSYELYPMWKLIVLNADWSSSSIDFDINGSKFQTLEVVYNDDTRVVDTTKDFIIAKSSTIETILDKIGAKGYDDKALGKLDMILDENRNIRHFEFEINTVEVLGKENLESEISEALHVSVTDPDHQIIVDVVDELLATGTVVINDDNFDVMEEFKKQVELLDYENDIKSHIPEVYKKLMSEESIIESYTHAKQQILDNITEALDHHTNGSTDVVDLTAITDVVIKTDLVGDLLIPKYNAAKDKFISEYESKVGAMDEEMERLIALISPDMLLNHDIAHVSYEDGLSGYSLKSNDEYYEIIKEIVVIGDEVGKTIKEKVEEKGVEEVADAFAEFATSYLTTINDYLDKYVDELIEKGYDALNKDSIAIVEKYKDRRLTEADIDKVKTALKKAINGYDTTTDEAFDLAVKAANKAMDKDKIEDAVNKYTQSITITDTELGATAKNIKVTLTRSVIVID